MWSKTVVSHKMLDIEKIPKKSPCFSGKNVDKWPSCLVYYLGTRPEKTPWKGP